MKPNYWLKAIGACTSAFLLLCCSDSLLATGVWSGLGTNSNWSTAGNWDTVPANNGTVTIKFGGTTGLNPFVDTPWSIAGLQFLAGAGAYTLGGSNLTIGSVGIANQSTSQQTINNNITMSAAQSILATSGDMVFNGTINNNGNLLTAGGAHNTIFNGAITGNGGLTKIDAGTVTLAAANGYNGETTINGGTLRLGTHQFFTGGLTLGGGTINLNGFTATFSGNFTVKANSTIDFAGGGSLIVYGTLKLGNNLITINNWVPGDSLQLPDPGRAIDQFTFTGYGAAVYQNGQIVPQNVPEPASATLLLLAVGGFGMKQWRARRKS